MQSSSCFTEGNRTLTQNGYKEVQTLKESDLIFTHQGSWKSITSVEQYIHNGTIISIYAATNSIPIEVTPDRPFLTKTIVSTGFGPTEFYLSDKTSWTPASGLKAGKHLLCLPIEQLEIPLNINIVIAGESRSSNAIDWFMVGYYLGLGGRVLEVEFIPPGWSILREFTQNPSENNTSCDHIPEWVQRLPIQDIQSFILGFEKTAANHGCYVVKYEQIAMAMQRLYAKTRRFVTINVKATHICLKEVDDYGISFDDKYMYFPIEHISDEFKKTTVYNIEVADDRSFVVEGVITRN